jgi:anaerobic selenocysteine-containing dehydrogenase
VGFLAALGATLSARPRWAPFAASIVYRTLGNALTTERAKPGHVSPAAAAPLLALALGVAARDPRAVRAAGHRGNRLTLGVNLFRSILDRPQGTLFTRHDYEDTWSFLKHEDRRIHLDIPEMSSALRALRNEPVATHDLVLLAGERRAYNANQIYRDPAWRRIDKEGAMRMHPDDARARGLTTGARAICKAARSELEVTIEVDDTVRVGMVTLPHGYGMRYRDGAPNGPELNRLTTSEHCDPLARTPFHKFVPVSVRAAF